MIDLAQVAGWAPLAWAFAVASVSLEAARRAWRASRAAPPRARWAVDTGLRVLIVRPCAGREPHLDRTLASLREARSLAALRCVLAVESEGDGAAPAARAAAEALSQAAIPARVAITGGHIRPFAPNRKAAQIAAVVAEEQERFDVLLVADSDVDLAGIDLDALLEPLCGPDAAAAVWAPPAERAAPRTLGDRASAAILGGSLHAFPLLAGLDPAGLVGKLCAIRADALERAGGFGALSAHLGEDMELGRRLRAQGGAVRVAPIIAPSLASGRALGDAIARYARWITVIRAQRPLLLPSYPALFCATPLLLALCVITAPLAPASSAAALALALAARLFTALVAARAAGRPASLRGALADAALADLALLAAFARAITSRKVVWRSMVLTVDRRGLLREASA